MFEGAIMLTLAKAKAPGLGDTFGRAHPLLED